ncbi:MAG: hypothetical protein QNJ22_22240 [Desulfosarcinaceae bacterium]|nr:hypothetical protein [Desulfosarcinaceae bacterium]
MTSARLPRSARQSAHTKLAHFITETTGIPPTAAALADALQRNFILNEIKSHNDMRRCEER